MLLFNKKTVKKYDELIKITKDRLSSLEKLKDAVEIAEQHLMLIRMQKANEEYSFR